MGQGVVLPPHSYLFPSLILSSGCFLCCHVSFSSSPTVLCVHSYFASSIPRICSAFTMTLTLIKRKVTEDKICNGIIYVVFLKQYFTCMSLTSCYTILAQYTLGSSLPAIHSVGKFSQSKSELHGTLVSYQFRLNYNHKVLSRIFFIKPETVNLELKCRDMPLLSSAGFSLFSLSSLFFQVIVLTQLLISLTIQNICGFYIREYYQSPLKANHLKNKSKYTAELLCFDLSQTTLVLISLPSNESFQILKHCYCILYILSVTLALTYV